MGAGHPLSFGTRLIIKGTGAPVPGGIFFGKYGVYEIPEEEGMPAEYYIESMLADMPEQSQQGQQGGEGGEDGSEGEEGGESPSGSSQGQSENQPGKCQGLDSTIDFVSQDEEKINLSQQEWERIISSALDGAAATGNAGPLGAHVIQQVAAMLGGSSVCWRQKLRSLLKKVSRHGRT